MPTSQVFTNAPSTVPTGSISNVATTIAVTSASGFPATAPYRINVSEGAAHEIMEVTAGAGTTSWTVSRAVEPVMGLSTAQTFTTAATVDHVLTAGALVLAVTQRQDVVWAPEPSGGDDTAALQALVTNNTIIQLRAGTYLFTALSISGITACVFRGYGADGRQTTLKALSGTYTDFDQRTFYFLNSPSCGMENLIIDGNRLGFLRGTAILGTTVNASITTFTVNTNQITAAANFYARIENEIIFVGAGGNTTSWSSITRGTNNSTAVGHTAPVTIEYMSQHFGANALVKVELSDDIVLRNLSIRDSIEAGIWLYWTQRAVVEDCEVLDANSNGILAYYKCDYLRFTNNRVLRYGSLTNPTLLPQPDTPTSVTATSGGTVLAGTYQIAVTWVTTTGTTETVISPRISQVTTGTTSTITVTRPAIPSAATFWRCYISALGGSTLWKQGSDIAVGTTTFVLTAPPNVASSNPPLFGRTSDDNYKGIGTSHDPTSAITIAASLCESPLIEGNLVDMDTWANSATKVNILNFECFGSPHSRITNNISLGPITSPTHGATNETATYGISTGQDADACSIISNVVRRNIQLGIEAAQATNACRIVGNMIEDYYIGITISTNSTQRADDSTITSNYLHNARVWGTQVASAAIQLNGDCRRAIVNGNSLIDFHQVGVFLLGVGVSEVTVANNLFVMKNAQHGIEAYAIQINIGTGHIITDNYFGPGAPDPGVTAGSACMRGVRIVGAAGIERFIIANNHFNGFAPNGSTKATDAIDFESQVEKCLIQGNTFENFSRSAIFQSGTLGTSGNQIVNNSVVQGITAPYYQNLKNLDLVVNLEDDHYTGTGTSSHLWDDFCAGLLTTGNIGSLDWGLAGTGSIAAGATVTLRPGIVRLTCAATGSTHEVLFLGSGTGTLHSFGIFSNFFDITWSINLVQTDANTVFRCGFANTMAAVTTVTAPTDWVGFEKVAADTSMFGVNKVGATNNRTAALVTISAATWYKLRARRISATSIGFTVNNGTEVSTATTSPTSVMLPFLHIGTATTTAKSVDIDYVDMQLTGLAR